MIHNDDLVKILRKLSIDLKFAADRVEYYGGFGEFAVRSRTLRVCKYIVDVLVEDMAK